VKQRPQNQFSQLPIEMISPFLTSVSASGLVIYAAQYRNRSTAAASAAAAAWEIEN
jgi:hypothetical protein